MLYDHLIAKTVMTLGVCRVQAFFYTDKCVAQFLCHSRASSLILSVNCVKFGRVTLEFFFYSSKVANFNMRFAPL